MSEVRLIDANTLIRRVNENEFYTDKLKRVLCSIVDAAPVENGYAVMARVLDYIGVGWQPQETLF